MARWRERLYSGLVRIATRQADFFHVPSDSVIELGTPVEI
jgi:KUP system potassium uptake protein